jgi:hypothetical protein
MMRRSLFGAAAVATLLLLGTSRPVEAQGLASLAAAASGSTMAVDKQPVCWGCWDMQNMPSMCRVSGGSGFTNCQPNFGGAGCRMTVGCGSSALLPVDLDGATQYVSRGSRLGVPVMQEEGDPDVRRNCKGVVIARFQTPDAIAQVRSSTGTLTL